MVCVVVAENPILISGNQVFQKLPAEGAEKGRMADAGEPQVRGLSLNSAFPFVNQANQLLTVLMVVLSSSNALLTLRTATVAP